jgi:MoaA/NifB/PqqE/SkfB family radical SAM enzyme
MKIEDTMNGFDVIWDLGRRCTYACTYCPPHRNNKSSPLVTFEDLKKSMTFLDDYVSIYEGMKGEPFKRRKLSFTGGEPTIHTGFLKFANYIKDTYGDRYTIGITTNGLFTTRQANLYKQFAGTISYHAEATDEEKKMVIDNIYLIKHWQVNVMFHKDYFDECIQLCEDLEEAGIKYIPRRIGDDGNDQSSIRNGYTHVYTIEQEFYFANHWRKKNEKKYGAKKEVDLDQMYVNADKKSNDTGAKKDPIVQAYVNPIIPTQKEVSQTDIEESLGKSEKSKESKESKDSGVTTYPSLMKDEDRKERKSQGRMCCGGRDICITTSDEPEGKLGTYVDNTNFFGYQCLVNWYFLYINQETRDIYHHQTCMVNLDNDVAPIGNLDESDKIIERLNKYYLEDEAMPVISCPKTFCGCGMCVDKMDTSYDIKEHNFGITKVALVPNVLKAMEDTRTITVRNRMESIDDALYIQNLNVK